MKKMIISAAAFSIVAIMAVAVAPQAHASTLTCTQPPTCKQIVSSEYSTGGGDKTFQMVEIGCRTADGGYVVYSDAVGSVSGFFGMGRIASYDKIGFVPTSKDEMDCK